jgi:hypothetical protein
VLTAASVSVVDVMAAIYADMDANSTWVMTEETQITGPSDPGDFSWTAQSPSGDVELNCLNNGTPGAPSATAVRLGINPDGSADPITDSEQPWLSAANFSGNDGGRIYDAAVANTEFLLIEYDNALMVLFKNAARTTTPIGWYWGKCWLQPVTLLEGVSDIALDGNVAHGGAPGDGSGGWVSVVGSSGVVARRRIAPGQTVDTVNAGTAGSWADPSGGAFSLIAPQQATNAAYYAYGPSNETVAFPIALSAQNGITHNADQGWLSRHIRAVPETLDPFEFWQAGGVNQYMVIGTAAAAQRTAIVIKAPFNPNP